MIIVNVVVSLSLDIDECVLGLCDASTTDCTNTVGGYNCTCKSGYQKFNVTTCYGILAGLYSLVYYAKTALDIALLHFWPASNKKPWKYADKIDIPAQTILSRPRARKFWSTIRDYNYTIVTVVEPRVFIPL